jgi:DNA-binding transcriptional MocR family regulator
MQAIAKLQGKSTLKFIWDELVVRMDQAYSKDTLAQFLTDGKVNYPPSVTDPFNEQKSKFMRMGTSELEKYERDLLKHIKILKTEMRRKKE